jgi:hypothetical protein
MLVTIQFRFHYLPFIFLVNLSWGCQTRSAILRKEHGLQVFQNKVLRRIL